VTRDRLAAALLLATGMAGASSCAARVEQGRGVAPAPAVSADAASRSGRLTTDLDGLFTTGPLADSLAGVSVRSLRTGQVLYTHNPGTRVIPASAMKVVTMAVAADRLGWDHRFTTRLGLSGVVKDGVLEGDLIVTGDGDPSIAAQDLRTAPVFTEWAERLTARGIRRVNGRLIGDDNVYDDEALGAGWAWDYLAAGYAAPSGALSYNENVAVLRVTPAAAAGASALVELGPAGHGLELHAAVTTAPADTAASLTIGRLPGSAALTVRGVVAVGSRTIIRTTTIDNPTRFFVNALRLALLERGIAVSGGTWDIDDLPDAPGASRQELIAEHRSAPLSSLIGYAMKVSQNFYGDMFLKAIGRADRGAGSAEAGRTAVRTTLTAWGLPTDALVMYDGSGLSRYNYASANLLVGVLEHVWRDERLRGPFVAALPVGGHDGTLESRMRGTPLDRRIQAKTGTINNVRSLAGYAETAAGDKLVFAMIANNYTAPNAQIDGAMERALELLTSP
jgi:D-alanyl-D-alanine carboxypeptidase/D-alanyl-D-alanine-endopeptidase (penicillin-binding protein 4)